MIGAGSTAPVRYSSIPAHRGRTPGSSRSTAGYATNCSTRGTSTRCWKPACHRRLALRLQRQQTPLRPRRTHPNRVRPTVDHDPPTPSRIGTGPPNGSPSAYRNQIVTHHDIGYVRYPESHSRSFRYLYRTAPRCSLRKSRSVLTVSEFYKTELRRYYGIDRQ